MPTKNGFSPSVSVIIPTLNAGTSLTTLLERLWQQTLAPIEIIVIDTESIDGTIERARAANARVLTVKRSEFDHGGTRNRAAEQAKGDILLFMTQDAMPYDERMIEQLVGTLFSDETIVYAYARQLAQPDADVLERLAREHNYSEVSVVKSYEDIEQLGIKAFFCSNVCSAIRRETFEEMGSFQEPVIFNEDMFLSAKCILSGYKVAYCAEAAVYHSHQYTVRQQFRRYFDNGISMRCNLWIWPYTAVGRAGSRLVKRQLKELLRLRKLQLIPRLVVESAAKLIGYKLGYHFQKLPASMTRRFSMHKMILTHIERLGVERGETTRSPGQ